jgi:pyruvate:ferredoxin oxidoreductase-like protein/pyruvate ferredoxin/flavodoxin oxidoreductase-like protein/pyruvate flavodoxin/ferredoxin oxidoreductase-like protein
MFQVRFHGRGGQGVVTAAELLASAAFREDRYTQAFPSFGSERMGAPVMSFCRIDDKPIRTHEPVTEPDALIIQDLTPVMVCMDGFLLTHASERVDLPSQDQVDAFLPPYDPRQVLDPDQPVSIGAMVGLEAFTEVRYLAHQRMRQALELIPVVSTGFSGQFGRESGGLVRPYRAEDAEVIVVALGSVLGTIQDTIDELRDAGMRAGALGITTFRPFPAGAVREALPARTRHLVVLERALAPGTGGIVTADIRLALADGRPVHFPRISTVIAGLGGRAITQEIAAADAQRRADAAAVQLPRRPWAARTSGSSARAATAARSTSAWHACPACSSGTTTCCTSATTTRRI